MVCTHSVGPCASLSVKEKSISFGWNVVKEGVYLRRGVKTPGVTDKELRCGSVNIPDALIIETRANIALLFA